MYSGKQDIKVITVTFHTKSHVFIKSASKINPELVLWPSIIKTLTEIIVQHDQRQAVQGEGKELCQNHQTMPRSYI